MKSALNKFTLALGIILIGTLLSGKAFAACGDSAKSKPGASLLSIRGPLTHFSQLIRRSDRRNVARDLHCRGQ